MQRTPLWKSIADTLSGEIAAGQYAPGDKLPTEAQLATRFGVNRHTVRQALASLAEADVLYARRGAGVFVTQVPTEYPIGKRVRFHQNLIAARRVPEKEILSLGTRSGIEPECTALELAAGAQVTVYEGVSLADSQPIALFRSVFPTSLFPSLLEDLKELKSVTEALKRSGIEDYTRVTTRLTAKKASATQALHLRIREGDPILRSVGINVDEDRRPVEFGYSWFAGDRVTLTLSDG